MGCCEDSVESSCGAGAALGDDGALFLKAIAAIFRRIKTLLCSIYLLLGLRTEVLQSTRNCGMGARGRARHGYSIRKQKAQTSPQDSSRDQCGVRMYLGRGLEMRTLPTAAVAGRRAPSVSA